jgi:acetoin utilization deacetylase AcuC-like enzyme
MAFRSESDGIAYRYRITVKRGQMIARKRTGIVRDPRYAGHCMEKNHPECPERLDVIYTMLDTFESRGLFLEITPRRAEKDELLRVHSPNHVRRLEATEGKRVYLDPDTITSPLSHEAALLASGGLCLAVEQVEKGLLDNAFALVRPPGHHAERDKTKGFCLYNNVAIAARYAQHTLGLARILIVDWDLHHGNGTQHCFEDNPSVLFFSVHRSFFYPGSGSLREVGKGPGKGYTVNIPLLPGFGDGDYLTLFEKILKPIALEFVPDFILVSAGFDIHYQDPLGGMQVTPKGFAAMTRSILQIAEHCCKGKVVMALEGGYDLEGLKDSVREVLIELADIQFTDPLEIMATADRKKMSMVLWRVKRAYKRYWKNLDTDSDSGLEKTPPLLDRMKECLSQMLMYMKN